MTYQWHPEYERLLYQLLEPALVVQARRAEAQIGKPARPAVYQGWNPEFLREPLELAGRRGALLEIDEVSFHPALGEEAQRLTSVGTFLETENLDFHGAGT